MRVAILGEPNGWHVRQLALALGRRGHAPAVVRWAELAATITGAGEAFAPPALDAADIVVVRGMPAADPPGRATAGPGRLETVIFRMDLLARLEARGTPVVNRPRALELAIDKYLSLARLAAAGLPVPRTAVVQCPEAVADAWETFGDCVVKPLFGSRGRGLARIRSREELAAWAAGPDAVATAAVHYVQEFVPHPGWDARILVIGGRAVAIRRTAAPGEWRTNLAQGGHATPLEPDAAWLGLARRAAALLGTDVAGVDLVPGADGRPLILEVNAVPGWKGTATATGVDVAAVLVEHLEHVFHGRASQDSW